MRLLLETELAEIVDDGAGRCEAVVTGAGERIECQFVGLTAGVSPNIDLVRDSELATGRGILVDRTLAASIEGVFAAAVRRGEAWLDETVRLGRLLDLLNAARLQAEFEREVLAPARAQLEQRIQEALAWLARREGDLLETALELLKQTAGPARSAPPTDPPPLEGTRGFRGARPEAAGAGPEVEHEAPHQDQRQGRHEGGGEDELRPVVGGPRRAHGAGERGPRGTDDRGNDAEPEGAGDQAFRKRSHQK